MAHASHVSTHEFGSIEEWHLAGTIADMDDLALVGVRLHRPGRARRVLEAMKRAPKGHPLHRSLEATLDAIWQVADMAANDINCQTEGVAARPAGAKPSPHEGGDGRSVRRTRRKSPIPLMLRLAGSLLRRAPSGDQRCPVAACASKSRAATSTYPGLDLINASCLASGWFNWCSRPKVPINPEAAPTVGESTAKPSTLTPRVSSPSRLRPIEGLPAPAACSSARTSAACSLSS